MSIDHLLDSTCRVWQHTEGTGSFGADTWTPPAGTEPCYLAPAPMDRSEAGAGQRDVGRRWLFMRLEAAVAVENVVEITDGPNSPSLWRVVAPPQHPRTHHTEAWVEPWSGTLPEEEGS